MTAAQDYEDMHRLVDLMTPAQVRELRRQALRLVNPSDESEQVDGDEPPIRHFSFAGALSAEHDLATRSEDILREEMH